MTEGQSDIVIELNNSSTWARANHRYLSAALDQIKHLLQRHSGEADESEEVLSRLQRALQNAVTALPVPPNLMRLSSAFQLSKFECALLLLCAGVELDGQLAELCAAAQWNPRDNEEEQTQAPSTMAVPTFRLALSVFPDAHWDALVPDSPLRYWRLIEIGPGTLLTTSPLRISEYVLHYLAGITSTDPQLTQLVSRQSSSAIHDLVPSQQLMVERLLAIWRQQITQRPPDFWSQHHEAVTQPFVQLCGEDVAGKHAIARAACTTLNCSLICISAGLLPTNPTELDQVMRLLERQSALEGSVLLLDCSELDTTDNTRVLAISHMISQIRSLVAVICRERMALPGLTRLPLVLDVTMPEIEEQRLLWQEVCTGHNLNGHIDQLIEQFHLSASTIRAAAASVSADLPTAQHPGELLWDACRLQTRPTLDALARRIEPHASWQDLVLPDAQLQLLQALVAQVRQRNKVYGTWGFHPGGMRGRGITALFAGASGTGKTLASEVIAHALRLDLYHIDLSAVVSKYIGETEKNLRRIFDAAEESGALLLFDEADAIFGKRSEVKDSQDRYANIEVSYLLQRMEAYRGLAILTTNLKQAVDTAFLRRIRFVVQFPFPTVPQRAEIWRRIFPASLPSSGLEIDKLARLNVAGGTIRNIALNAAFLAADVDEPLQMSHLRRAAIIEYAKLEKPLTETEIGDWVQQQT